MRAYFPASLTGMKYGPDTGITLLVNLSTIKNRIGAINYKEQKKILQLGCFIVYKKYKSSCILASHDVSLPG